MAIAKKKKKKTTNKSEFIRQQPPQLSAAEVVKKAKDAGLSITVQRVYSIRYAARRKLGKPASTKARASSRKSLPRDFVSLVAAIGLTRAEELLESFRAKIGSA